MLLPQSDCVDAYARIQKMLRLGKQARMLAIILFAKLVLYFKNTLIQTEVLHSNAVF